MTDDGIKITLRMGTEELQALEDFMGERDLEDRCPRKAGSSSASATCTWMRLTSSFSAEYA